LTLLDNPSLCLKLTGLTVNQVYCLSNRISSMNIGWKFSPIGMTLLLLLWLRQYPVDYFIEWIFGVPQSSFVKYRWQIIFKLFTHYNNSLLFPSKADRSISSVKFRNNTVVMVVDGTEQKCIAHVDRRVSKTTRSGKKKTNTITKLAGINPSTGKLMYFVCSYRGGESDMALCKIKANIPIGLGDDETVLFDKGFVGIEEYWNCNCVYPVKKKKGTGPCTTKSQGLQH